MVNKLINKLDKIISEYVNPDLLKSSILLKITRLHFLFLFICSIFLVTGFIGIIIDNMDLIKYSSLIGLGICIVGIVLPIFLTFIKEKKIIEEILKDK